VFGSRAYDDSCDNLRVRMIIFVCLCLSVCACVHKGAAHKSSTMHQQARTHGKKGLKADYQHKLQELIELRETLTALLEVETAALQQPGAPLDEKEIQRRAADAKVKERKTRHIEAMANMTRIQEALELAQAARDRARQDMCGTHASSRLALKSSAPANATETSDEFVDVETTEKIRAWEEGKTVRRREGVAEDDLKRKKGVLGCLVKLLSSGKEDELELKRKAELATSLAHVDALHGHDDLDEHWQHHKMRQVFDTAQLHHQQEQEAAALKAMAPREIHIRVRLVEGLSGGGTGGGGGGGGGGDGENVVFDHVKIHNIVMVEALSTDTLQEFKRKISHRFADDLDAIAPCLQRIVFGGALLLEDADDVRVGGRSISERSIEHHSLVHVLVPANTLPEEEEEKDARTRQRSMPRRHGRGGVDFRPGEKIRHLENLLERAELADSKREQLEIQMPHYWEIARMASAEGAVLAGAPRAVIPDKSSELASAQNEAHEGTTPWKEDEDSSERVGPTFVSSREKTAAAAKQMAAQEQEDVSAIAKLKTRAQMLASQLSKEIEVVPSRGDTARVGVGMILRSRRLTGGKAKERAQAVSEQLSGKLKLEQAPPVASVQAPRGGSEKPRILRGPLTHEALAASNPHGLIMPAEHVINELTTAPEEREREEKEEEEEEEEEIYVSCLKEGGVAQMSGEIEIGDVVLKVSPEHSLFDSHRSKDEVRNLETFQHGLMGVPGSTVGLIIARHPSDDGGKMFVRRVTLTRGDHAGMESLTTVLQNVRTAEANRATLEQDNARLSVQFAPTLPTHHHHRHHRQTSDAHGSGAADEGATDFGEHTVAPLLPDRIGRQGQAQEKEGRVDVEARGSEQGGSESQSNSSKSEMSTQEGEERVDVLSCFKVCVCLAISQSINDQSRINTEHMTVSVTIYACIHTCICRRPTRWRRRRWSSV